MPAAFNNKSFVDMLNNAENMTPQEIRESLIKQGFVEKSQNSRSTHYWKGDADVHIDAPDRTTDYNHIHVINKATNQRYGKGLTPVGRKTPDAHIRIRGFGLYW